MATIGAGDDPRAVEETATLPSMRAGKDAILSSEKQIESSCARPFSLSASSQIATAQRPFHFKDIFLTDYM